MWCMQCSMIIIVYRTHPIPVESLVISCYTHPPPMCIVRRVLSFHSFQLAIILGSVASLPKLLKYTTGKISMKYFRIVVHPIRSSWAFNLLKRLLLIEVHPSAANRWVWGENRSKRCVIAFIAITNQKINFTKLFAFKAKSYYFQCIKSTRVHTSAANVYWLLWTTF